MLSILFCYRCFKYNNLKTGEHYPTICLIWFFYSCFECDKWEIGVFPFNPVNFTLSPNDNEKPIKSKIISTCKNLNVSLIATCDNNSLNDSF